ncbi:uncharacterized protein LOC106866220 isoform X2 [Brachypodium distachyon]|uniref:uncharacterized protein LOC106866220 isoform X2 n=1 Tax=Brachypodium distachyon TaxID=15368 RepID=UPI000D0E0386|nr:uncharacterized protein LOC106866220 isoform X2 [Brachypodium distachyon]|eukprot:XP_024314294.1 uncharacterized protein LOC106866220 isoform X2 [Brachypodium distachyon]
MLAISAFGPPSTCGLVTSCSGHRFFLIRTIPTPRNRRPNAAPPLSFLVGVPPSPGFRVLSHVKNGSRPFSMLKIALKPTRSICRDLKSAPWRRRETGLTTRRRASRRSTRSTPPSSSSRVPLRTTSGHSWGLLGQFVTDWNGADSYKVTSSTLQATPESVGPPPAATPESVATRMYQARVALFEASRSSESCMNKRTATFKTLLAKYKKLEAEHETLKADRKSQTGDTAQVAELLKRVAEVQDEKTWLAEQHQEEITRLQAQIAAQAEAHQTEVGQLTSALSSQADEKIRLESEVKKCKGLVSQLETRATAAELEDAEKTQLFKVVRHELIRILPSIPRGCPRGREDGPPKEGFGSSSRGAVRV